jgi:hypothetical protein
VTELCASDADRERITIDLAETDRRAFAELED